MNGRAIWGRGKDRFLEGLSKSYSIAGRSFAFVRGSRAVSWLKSQFPTVPTLLAVMLGFGLKAYWDSAEAARVQRVEVQRTARSVALELQSNLDLVGFNLDYIDQDIAAADKNLEVVPSLYVFSTVAGEAAFLKGSFELVSAELTEQIAKIDTVLDGLNQRIQQRDVYRFTNVAMSNFATTRKIFDQDLRERLVSARSSMTRLLEDVRRLRGLEQN